MLNKLVSSQAVNQFKSMHTVQKIGIVLGAELRGSEPEYGPGVYAKIGTKYLLPSGEYGVLNVILAEYNAKCKFFTEFAQVSKPTLDDTEPIKVDYRNLEDRAVRKVLEGVIGYFMKRRDVVGTVGSMYMTLQKKMPEEKKKAVLREQAEKLYRILPKYVSWSDRIVEVDKMLVFHPPDELVLYELEPPYPRGVLVQPKPGGSGALAKDSCHFLVAILPGNEATWKMEGIENIWNTDDVDEVIKTLMNLLLPV